MKEKDASTTKVDLAQSQLTMVRTNLDALQERFASVIRMITNLEETLRLAREEEC